MLNKRINKTEKRSFLIVLLFLFFAPMVVFGQDSAEGNQYQLKGNIIRTVRKAPHCGVMAWATVVEFEIITYSDSSYTKDSIGVIVRCPEFYKKGFFVVGDTYQVSLIDQNTANFSWSMLNEASLDKYDLKKPLYVTSIERVE